MTYKEIPPESFNIDDLHFHCAQPTQPTGAQEGKIAIRLCCPKTVEVFEGLRPFAPSKDEFDFFISAFHKHYTANDYIRATENDRDAILKKVFQRAKLLRPDLRGYYLNQIREDASNLLKDQAEMRIDFQAAFDSHMREQGVTENRFERQGQITSVIRLNSSKQGAKTDLLRILDALYELHFFTDEAGQVATKESVMKAFGEFLGNDFSAFANSLSQSYITTSLEANLAVFEKLKAKIQEKCISKT